MNIKRDCCQLPGINMPLDKNDIYINFKALNFISLIVVVIIFVYVASIGNLKPTDSNIKPLLYSTWADNLETPSEIKEEEHQLSDQAPSDQPKADIHYGLLTLLIGAFSAFWGWELSWSTGCGLGDTCGRSYLDRHINKSVPITQPTWFNGLINALFDGCIIGISFMLGLMLFPQAATKFSIKFTGFIVFIGVLQNMLATYLFGGVVDFNGLANSILARNPVCQDPSNIICWYNQDMWVKLPIICYIFILLINLGKKTRRRRLARTRGGEDKEQ